MSKNTLMYIQGMIMATGSNVTNGSCIHFLKLLRLGRGAFGAPGVDFMTDDRMGK